MLAKRSCRIATKTIRTTSGKNTIHWLHHPANAFFQLDTVYIDTGQTSAAHIATAINATNSFIAFAARGDGTGAIAVAIASFVDAFVSIASPFVTSKLITKYTLIGVGVKAVIHRSNRGIIRRRAPITGAANNHVSPQ